MSHMFFSSEQTSYLLEALAKGRNMKLIASNIRIQNAPKPWNTIITLRFIKEVILFVLPIHHTSYYDTIV